MKLDCKMILFFILLIDANECFVNLDEKLVEKIMKHLLSFFVFISCFAAFTLAQQTKIVFIGNSITQGVILDNPQEEAPPVQAVRWLEQQNMGKIEFRNCGVSGKTTVDFLPATNTFFAKVKAAADELSKENGVLVFSIMLGTNDSVLRGNSKSRLQPEQYYTNMKAITDELLRLYPASRVVLNRPVWYSPTTHNTSTYLQEGLNVLESYFPMLKKLTTDYSETFPGQVFLGDTTAFDYFKDNKPLFYAENGNSGRFYLHPNKAGAQKLGEFWGKAIKSALQQKEWTEYPLSTVKEKPVIDADASRGIVAPTLRVYLPDPDKATGRMVIALPGGGYQGLAVFHEGFDWAPYFLSKGIALGVLKYRMPKGNSSVPFTDVKAAFDLVKQHAAEWHVNPDDIGIMGSSAGGHLASTYATHTTGTDRPAFQILLYPVITMDETFTHAGSRKNLIGENPSKELIEKYSNEKQITKETSRAFIIFASDDKVVPPQNGFRYVESLQQSNVPVTFLLYPTGGHGFGYRETYSYHSLFLSELSKWLKGF